MLLIYDESAVVEFKRLERGKLCFFVVYGKIVVVLVLTGGRLVHMAFGSVNTSVSLVCGDLRRRLRSV